MPAIPCMRRKYQDGVRTERIIESTEPNLTKKSNCFVLFFRRFFELQASYGAETLTSDRSRAPGRFEKLFFAGSEVQNPQNLQNFCKNFDVVLPSRSDELTQTNGPPPYISLCWRSFLPPRSGLCGAARCVY